MKPDIPLKGTRGMNYLAKLKARATHYTHSKCRDTANETRMRTLSKHNQKLALSDQVNVVKDIGSYCDKTA